jgi:ligand-binding SRPBCC domain-containing protein
VTTFKLIRNQFLPISKYRAWDFFSSPRNLLLVTPRRLDLKIRDVTGGERMYEGQVIKHRVSVLPFVRIDWVTRITDVTYYECFTIRQIKGPYSHWVHKHCFRPAKGGIEMSDEIEYALPLPALISRGMNSLLVKRELDGVFTNRENVIQEYFGFKRIDTRKLEVVELVTGRFTQKPDSVC